MRLLNTETVELHEFFEKDIPGYAILSHRWEQDEVTFKDVTKRKNLEAAGWNKIKCCCSFVRTLGFDWAWIDTCCIDKRSSSELSEAINSMYGWYQRADVCFVYLKDVHCRDEEVQTYKIPQDSRRPGEYLEPHKEPLGRQTIDVFRNSQWFTRGWTLQELLATRNVIFVDNSWRIFGSKDSLDALISGVTGIAGVSSTVVTGTSIATRMSWAANRECTRSEDLAYSLMGIFAVNMPLLYGEGAARAFARLQLEILRQSGDESIFAFQNASKRGDTLARSPAQFARSSGIRPFPPTVPRAPYAITNKGLNINTVLLPGRIDAHIDNARIYFMPLNCAREGALKPLVVPLRRIDHGVYMRYGGRGWDGSLKWPDAEDMDVEDELKISTILVVNRDYTRDAGFVGNTADEDSALHSLRAALDNWMSDTPQPRDVKEDL